MRSRVHSTEDLPNDLSNSYAAAYYAVAYSAYSAYIATDAISKNKIAKSEKLLALLAESN
ncbi:MAG TPA: hypothetical protein PLF59_08090 [Cyclobacteriaceae bacterium]|nr:hypothetical protein [Cyclobacteriaceae bacterium]